MKTSLIQRAKFSNRPSKKGIDSIIELEHMGSSEFEWGALPESLSMIRREINDFVYLEVKIQNKVITVFCKNSQKNQIQQYLIDLSENKWHLKEYSDFDNYIKNNKTKTDFWWDIQNHLMFWKKDEDFEKSFKTIIATKPN